MIINIDSILGLCSDLFYTDEHPIKYLLTYKLSQDHLELFFNAVRRIGGWNNNPTVVQFKAAFRRLISRAGTTTSGSSGNVVGMDDTAIIQASTSTYVPSTVSRNSEDDMPLDNEIADNYYNFNAKHTLLIDNVLVYISGYVVRKALPQLKCFICRSVIVNPATTYNNTHFLITIKDNGGLLKPSDGLVKIITIAEKLLRYMSPKNTPSHSCTMLKLQAAVLEEVGGVDLLKLKSHIDDTHLGIDNHYYDLIRLVVGIFFKLRQHHIVRLHNIKLKAKSIRQKLTKSILFMGQ
ncbi:hypothetical protein SNE40_021217 [Patella caerulea]|uniref:Uncharacterized protein n=1 Tax=Patella caerulea TaxID=87958 RepID=A0AAN8IXA2_PATCE